MMHSQQTTSKKSIRFLAPFAGQELTDIALHFKWMKEPGEQTNAYEIELTDGVTGRSRIRMQVNVPAEADVGYYFPQRAELPIHSGSWYAKIRAAGDMEWRGEVAFHVDTEHSRQPVRRKIDAEHPWFTIFDYSEHEPGAVWYMLPENLKQHVGIGLIASYKAPTERVLSYMMEEDARGYLWHLGAMGPHEIQFGKYTVTCLSEAEYVFQHSKNLVSAGFVEQYLGTKEETYWRNEYFFRLLILCAKYGITFIYSDGNRNQMEWAEMIRRPFFMDVMREYSEWLILGYKQNHAHASYSCYAALLGAWMDGACGQIGMQAENWYWNDAGFRDHPGDTYGYLQGNEHQMPAGMTVEMLTMGLALGAAHYACEGESWLIEVDVEGRLVWSETGRMMLAWIRRVLEHRLIPSREQVLEKIRYVIDYPQALTQESDSAWTGGKLRSVFEDSYEICNGFELFPRKADALYLPLQTDREQNFSAWKRLRIDAEMKKQKPLAEGFQGMRGNAFAARVGDVYLIQHSRENEAVGEWFSVTVDRCCVKRVSGALQLWQYLLMKVEEESLWIYTFGRSGENLRLTLEADGAEQMELCLTGGAPEEYRIHRGDVCLMTEHAADMTEMPEETRPELLTDHLPEKTDITGVTGTVPELPAIDRCADMKYGRLPLTVDHLCYCHGMSVPVGAAMQWRLAKNYRRMTFTYGFDIDAWLPEILDSEHILWDRTEKEISVKLQIFGNGGELFCSPELTGTTGVFFGEVILTDVTELEIRVTGHILPEDSGEMVYLDILNPVLTEADK